MPPSMHAVAAPSHSIHLPRHGVHALASLHGCAPPLRPASMLAMQLLALATLSAGAAQAMPVVRADDTPAAVAPVVQADGARGPGAPAARADAPLLAQAAAPAPPAAAAPGPTGAPPAGPAAAAAKPARAAAGSFDIDEDAAQRALERTLTQSGALLLQPGTLELTPGFQYTRVEQTSPILLSFTAPQTGQPTTSIAESRIRRNEFTARLDLRYGLPHDAQVEFGLPYTRATAQQNNSFDAVNSSSTNRLGDITLGIARTFAREKGPMPDLIGRLSLNTGSGSRVASPLSTGAGYRQLQAELVAVKRQDPLAFVASASYAHVFEKDGVRPGDAGVVSLSALLAASPATSLQLGFAQVVRGKQELNGARQDGTDQTYGVVTLGASSVLSRDVTLVTQFGIGLGSDAPKYTIGIAFPIVLR